MSLIKGWNKNTLDWNECIDIYNNVIEHSDSEEILKFENNMAIYGGITTPVAKIKLPGFFSCRHAHINKKVQDALKMSNTNEADMYFNITSKAGTSGLHYDVVDVYYWQCIGKVKIIVQEIEFYLEPGDMLKIPKFIKHDVIPITPRMGISMAAKHKE